MRNKSAVEGGGDESYGIAKSSVQCPPTEGIDMCRWCPRCSPSICAGFGHSTRLEVAAVSIVDLSLEWNYTTFLTFYSNCHSLPLRSLVGATIKEITPDGDVTVIVGVEMQMHARSCFRVDLLQPLV